jgi:hypothetical protein
MRNLTGTLGMNYSHGSSNFPVTSFDSVGLTAGLNYLIGPVFANLTYNWQYFANSFQQSGPGTSDYAFSKKMIILSFSYAFTTQQLYRVNQFGFVGPIDAIGGGATGSPASGDGSAAPPPVSAPKN